ncbi:MAG: hypothetical protein O3A00_24330 [Planctomycetota bacterium]|nr:hypothetical protein [Planctomycetota bacterium]
MKQPAMKIQKGDVQVIILSALGGFFLVFFSAVGNNLGAAVLLGLLFGVPSGAGGGTLACILNRKGLFRHFRRYVAKK